MSSLKSRWGRLHECFQKQQPVRVVVVSDYNDNLAEAEVELAFCQAYAECCVESVATALPENFQFHRVRVPKFDTMAGGFALAQLAVRFAKVPVNTIFFINVAPRREKKLEESATVGEPFVVGSLVNGALFAGPNAGYCFSFLREHINQVATVQFDEKGIQFRSRDLYPRRLVQLMCGKEAEPLEACDDFGNPNSPCFIRSLPDAPTVIWIDGYGNLKLLLRSDSELLQGLQDGDSVRIKLAALADAPYFEAHLAMRGSFSRRSEELVLSSGSSGAFLGESWHFCELFIRGESAAERHLHLHAGSMHHELLIEPVPRVDITP